jgi:hypothetical protein
MRWWQRYPTQAPIRSRARDGLKHLRAHKVVVDLANSPSFEDRAVLDFFQTSGRDLLAAEAAAGVNHHVALSVVASDRLPDNGYLRAKVAEESLIKASSPIAAVRRVREWHRPIGHRGPNRVPITRTSAAYRVRRPGRRSGRCNPQRANQWHDGDCRP